MGLKKAIGDGISKVRNVITDLEKAEEKGKKCGEVGAKIKKFKRINDLLL